MPDSASPPIVDSCPRILDCVRQALQSGIPTYMIEDEEATPRPYVGVTLGCQHPNESRLGPEAKQSVEFCAFPSYVRRLSRPIDWRCARAPSTICIAGKAANAV
jgi:hypothetical protein